MAINAKRMYLVHLQSGDAVSAQFNPQEVKEAIEVMWRKIELQGESHEPMEYSHTKNLECEFTLAFDAHSGQGLALAGSLPNARKVISHEVTERNGGRIETTTLEYDVLLVRRFLQACAYPMRGARNVRAAAPSKILVAWPGFYSLAMRLEKVEFTYTQWETTDGPPILFTAALKFAADSNVRLYYEDILAHGTERHDASGAFVGSG